MSGTSVKTKAKVGGGEPPLASAPEGPRRTPPNGVELGRSPDSLGEPVLNEYRTTVLGEVAEFIRGITFKPGDVVPVEKTGSVACLRTKNVQAELNLTDVWGVDRRFVNHDTQLLQFGDVLISSANSWNLVGKCCWIPELPWPTTFGGFVTVLRPDRSKIDPRFLYRWFSSERIQSTIRSFGQSTTNISNLNLGRCLNLRLDLPSISEQRRIAEVLDRANDLKTIRRQSISHLIELAHGLFVEMFGVSHLNPKGWPQKNLGNLLATDPQNGIYKPSSDYGSGSPILRIDGFYDGIVTNASELKRVRLSSKEIFHYQLRAGDIVINRVNSMEYLGKSAVIPELSEPTVFESNMMRFSVNPAMVHPIFLIHFLQTDFVKAQISNAAKHAVNQSSINQTDVKSFVIATPPLPLQLEFVARIKHIEKLKSAHISSLAQLDALFASLQHRAFRGEL